MKSNNKIKSIFTLCALLGVGSLFYSPQTLAQQQSDSSMLRPSSPTIGSLQQASSNTDSSTMPTATTITEERYGTCPAGKIGVKSRTSKFVEAYRNITTYRLDGQVIGETVGPWIDNDEDCTGVETRSLSCPALMKGDYIQERNVVTDDNGNNNNSGWKTVKYTCDYYFIRNDYETRSIGCPSGYSGSKTERRDFQVWSNNNRAHSNWYVNHDSCTRPKKSGSTFLVSAVGHTFGFNGTHTATLNINNATGSLSCYGVFTSFNDRIGDTPDTYAYGPFSTNDASCSISRDGKTGTVWGDCDRTSGGDADACIPATKTVTVNNTSSDGCIIYMTVNYRPTNVDTCR